jgi:hypothetical protein
MGYIMKFRYLLPHKNELFSPLKLRFVYLEEFKNGVLTRILGPKMEQLAE